MDTAWTDTQENISVAKESQRQDLHRSSLGIALGSVLGIFPVLGISTLLCLAASLILRLNIVWIQIANYAVYPLQLILAPLFIFAGSWLMGDPLTVEGAKQIVATLRSDTWQGLLRLKNLLFYSVVIWLLISPLLFGVLYAAVRHSRAALKPGSSTSKVIP